jgi:DegV family protein with EDD domain
MRPVQPDTTAAEKRETMTIHLITDTTAGLPQPIVDEFNIPVVPQYVHFGEETLLDTYEIDTRTFYERQAVASELPKTSAPTVGEFLKVFEPILSEEPDATILCIHPSTEVSGTVRSAHPAADQVKETYPQADIRIFDTRSISVGLGLAVWEAARMIRAGETADAIMARMAFMRDNLNVYFVVDTLDYLAKGGRIGRAAHLLGSLLDIKPVLKLTDGFVDSHSKARTRRRTLGLMREYVLEGADRKPGLRLGVAHAVCEAEAREFADSLCAELNPDVFLFAELGPAIGAHAGPNTIAVGWVNIPDGMAQP